MSDPSQRISFWVAKTAVIALILLLVGHRFGFAISLDDLAIAFVLAAILHFGGGKLLALIQRKP